MGLFDDVECDYPLPDSRHQKARFQTKNLGCGMGRFTITADGRLISEPTRTDPGPGTEWPFHGDIWLFDYTDGVATEYVVRFTHGHVEWVRPAGEHEREWPEGIPFILKNP